MSPIERKPLPGPHALRIPPSAATVDLKGIFREAARRSGCALPVPDLPLVVGDRELLLAAVLELVEVIGSRIGRLAPVIHASRSPAEHIVVIRWEARSAEGAHAACEAASLFPRTHAAMKRHGGNIDLVVADLSFQAMLFLPLVPSPARGNGPPGPPVA